MEYFLPITMVSRRQRISEDIPPLNSSCFHLGLGSLIAHRRHPFRQFATTRVAVCVAHLWNKFPYFVVFTSSYLAQFLISINKREALIEEEGLCTCSFEWNKEVSAREDKRLKPGFEMRMDVGLPPPEASTRICCPSPSFSVSTPSSPFYTLLEDRWSSTRRAQFALIASKYLIAKSPDTNFVDNDNLVCVITLGLTNVHLQRAVISSSSRPCGFCGRPFRMQRMTFFIQNILWTCSPALPMQSCL